MIFVIKTIVPNFKAKRFTQKGYLKSINIGSCCGKVFTVANFNSLSNIKLFFIFHGIIGKKPLYVSSIWKKFKAKKLIQKRY
jgi:hypothetical protein